ncbi:MULTISPECIES: hypothetical protein [unclassified Treponema]|uniref:hypothetical protein n=1 Tax=unclassified Treponema TaxID=2638727 RepID=UPI0005301374|nr:MULTISPECIES: hypothetical protein [unclassified Treponema]AIW88719.1 hypothetical protein JO41_01995 [Treponema sp. OMZ 838]UTC51280.1 hypothetical protein E4N65_02740 [Treponema sp. OMZ 855]
MKKLYVNSVSILFAVLCLVFTACNGMLTDGDTGTVRVVIGGGGAARSVDAAGLPIFHKDNTTITVTDENGHKLVDAEHRTDVMLQLPVGTEITIEVKVTTAAGEWRGSEEHTVTAGDNLIFVKLSKTPKIMRNILINGAGRAASLKLESGEQLLKNIPIEHSAHHDVHPVIARDSIGRIYVLYRNKHSVTQTTHLRRIDVEGNGGTDTGFHDKIVDALPPSTIDTITNMAIDVKHNYIFLFDGSTVYCLKEKEDHSFEYIVQDSFPIPVSSPNVSAAAVYDDVLFVVYGTTLYACKFKIEELPAHPGRKRLQFKPVGGPDAASLNLPKLRTDTVFGNNLTNCTGLFADEDNVYCLLSENSVAGNQWYMVGSVVQCAYKDNGTLEQKGVKGLNPKAGGTDPVITFDTRYFSNPVGFIGSDEDNLYIADDGVDFAYINENWHITANKNRIAVLNRKTHGVTFKDAGATWYEQKPEYKLPNTKILLWEKSDNGVTVPNYYGMKYWLADNANTPCPTIPDDQFWFSSEQTTAPTDVFCYDQDGNLYILWKDNSLYCTVRRFALKEDGSYDKTSARDLDLRTSTTIAAIAVDISNGENYLYYAEANSSSPHTIKRFKWGHASGYEDFPDAEAETYSITVPASEKVTALAANNDGVFVGVRTISISPAGYTLSVKKYAKQDGADKGAITVGELQLTPTEPSGPYPQYTKIDNTVNDLRIVNGVLYAITSKLEKNMKYGDPAFSYYGIDEFKSSGILYKIAETAKTLFSGDAEKVHEKSPIPPDGTDPGVSYGFYRFIAVKPKKLVIASDGAYAVGGNTSGALSPLPDPQSDNKVLEYDLDGNLNSPEEKEAGGKFSMELCPGSGFEWK